MPEQLDGRLNAETRRIWDMNAEWWDDRIGDGNGFQRLLIEPSTEHLLEDIAGQTILDVGCGAGRFARRMVELGARVVAFDFSERFINRARQRTPKDAAIEYHVVDATDYELLIKFGKGHFDQAVATMALMDVSAVDPLFRALAVLLKPGGHFTFTILHPCFNPPDMTRYAECSERDGKIIRQNGVKISRYLTSISYRGLEVRPKSAQYM